MSLTVIKRKAKINSKSLTVMIPITVGWIIFFISYTFSKTAEYIIRVMSYQLLIKPNLLSTATTGL